MKQPFTISKKVSVALLAFVLTTPAFLSATEQATPSLVAVKPMTLDEALQKMQVNYPTLKAASAEVVAADARLRKSKGYFFPQVTASAGYTWLDTVSEMGFGGGAPIQFMPHDNYDAKLSLKTTLLDFGKRSDGVTLAEIGKKSAEEQLELTRRELSWQTVQLFYGMLFLRDQLQVHEKELAALNKAVEYTTKRYQTGMATSFDLSSTNARLAARQAAKLEVEHELHRNEAAFRRLIGVAPDAPLSLQGSFAITPTSATDGSELVTNAMAHRLEVQLAKNDERSAVVQRSLADKGGAPTVSSAISYGYTNGYQPDIQELRGNTAIHVQLDVPLFTGFRTRSEQQERVALERAARERRREVELQTVTEVTTTLDALHTAAKKITITQVEIEQATLAAQHARIRYQNGMATALDLLNSEAALAQAEFARLQASYAYVMNSYALKRLTGERFW